MNEFEILMRDNIIDSIAPIVVPLPFAGKYESEIELIDVIPLSAISFNKNNIVHNYNFFSLDIEPIKSFMLQSLFKIQESMIIYNDIGLEIVDDFVVYILKITIKKGNQTITYRYNTDNRERFTTYVTQYSILASKNKMEGMKKEIDNIIMNINQIGIHKFKAKRKSLLSN